MRRIIFLSLVFAAIFVGQGFSTGRMPVRETRNVSGFTKVSFGIAGELYIRLGKEFRVELEGDKSIIDDIETNVSGGKLVIRKENWRFNGNERVTVYITMPEIEGLGVSGSGRAEIKDQVKGQNLTLSVSGSGKLYAGDLAVDKMECSISGSGNIFVEGSGNASKADIAISGSGNYSSETLKIGTAEIAISGSGNCTCSVTDALRASISGSGDVWYTGNPKVDARVSGSGKVRSK